MSDNIRRRVNLIWLLSCLVVMLVILAGAVAWYLEGKQWKEELQKSLSS